MTIFIVLVIVMVIDIGIEYNKLRGSSWIDSRFVRVLKKRGYIKKAQTVTPADVAGITIIDVSGTLGKKGPLTSLKGIEYFTSLKELYCCFNQLTELNLSKNTQLITLNCGFNRLTELDLSNNARLASLGCYANQLTQLDVSHNRQLTELSCIWNRLTRLDVSQNTRLMKLDCYDNPGIDENFRVMAWFDNDSIPADFTKSSWLYDGNRVTIDYYKENMKQKIDYLSDIFRRLVGNYKTMGESWRNIPLAQEAFELTKSLPDVLSGEYESPAEKASLLCQMLDHMIETDTPRLSIKVREYIRTLDPDNDENNQELAMLYDYINPQLPMKEFCERYRRHLFFDPVERSERWEEIIYDVEQECHQRLEDHPRGMGFCHGYWHEKADVLRSYGIEWRSPSAMNPRVMFD